MAIPRKMVNRTPVVAAVVAAPVAVRSRATVAMESLSFDGHHKVLQICPGSIQTRRLLMIDVPSQPFSG